MCAVRHIFQQVRKLSLHDGKHVCTNGYVLTVYAVGSWKFVIWKKIIFLLWLLQKLPMHKIWYGRKVFFLTFSLLICSFVKCTHMYACFIHMYISSLRTENVSYFLYIFSTFILSTVHNCIFNLSTLKNI